LTVAGNITAAEDLYAGQLTLRGSVGGAFGVINGIIDLGTSGTLQKTDASTWTINSTFAAGNSWAELGVTNGTLKLGANNVSPPTAPLIMGENANSGILDLNGHNQTVANITPLGTGNRTITNADLGTPSTFTIQNAVDGAFYDSDSAAPNANAARIRGNLNLVKSGPANFVLGTLSSHDYTGTTTLSNGSLIVDGTHTGGDLYTVQSGATLGGSGIIGSGVQINNGGSIAPGSASGSTFTIGGLILSNNAVGRFELENTAGAHAAGGVSDYLDIVGVLDIASVTTTVSLHVSAVGGGNLAAAGSWTLLSADAINPGSWNINNIDTLFAVTGISAAYSHDLEFDTNTGNLLLTTTATGVLPGDFNNDGKVNAADYVVWRKTMPGNAAKYNEWRANFGNPPGSGSGLSDDGSVPEPNALALVVLGAMALAASRRRHP
jgi:autotransporter-associated beta strand protein